MNHIRLFDIMNIDKARQIKFYLTNVFNQMINNNEVFINPDAYKINILKDSYMLEVIFYARHLYPSVVIHKLVRQFKYFMKLECDSGNADYILIIHN